MSDAKVKISDKDVLQLAINDYEARKSENVSAEAMFKNGVESEPKSTLTDSEDSFLRETTLEYARELIEMGAEWFDESAKARSLPGLGEIGPGRYSRIAFLIAKKRVPQEWLANSPEITLGFMTTKILMLNGIELQKQKRTELKKSSNGSN